MDASEMQNAQWINRMMAADGFVPPSIGSRYETAIAEIAKYIAYLRQSAMKREEVV